MMVFDPSLDALTEDRNDLGLPLYFEKPTNQPEETILQTSYGFFLLIADITRQSRLSRPLDRAEVLKWRSLDRELSRWIGLTSSADMTLGLCYLAVCILLQKTNPGITSAERSRRVRSCLEEGLPRLPLLNIECYPPVYLLWPVAILGAVAASLDERNIVQDCIGLVVAKKLGGQGAWVQKRLARIWKATSSAFTSPEPNLAGLQSLLDGT
ncbi:fungal Zn binuclear cluster domain-containing protein [Aspergillus affinis]|uniref:fungal Zn binuclear cluster domain-containing protein n=1 Tax=Aspergillus affinis TaxID=1070780 RepID=UPI0022FDDA4C|nr:fungal Zn binuclear cluster domain-containing protein [Aspergillus affinis]KAI9038323.1 fungal Zn binuclear cluster domain-containing protein [Aspergillus affinis]